jgi:hypothetical protein
VMVLDLIDLRLVLAQRPEQTRERCAVGLRLQVSVQMRCRPQ